MTFFVAEAHRRRIRDAGLKALQKFANRGGTH
jgi:hypothetical protein